MSNELDPNPFLPSPEPEQTPEERAAGTETSHPDYETHAETPPRPQPPRGYPAPPPAEPKVRRVGVITMGVALIFAGFVAILSLFIPSFDIITCLKLTPVLLIFLGLEILLNFLVFKGAKLKYDLLSGFFCFLLIVGSVCAVAAPRIFEQWGPRRYEMEDSINESIENIAYEALSGNRSVLTASCNVYLNGVVTYRKDATYEDLSSHDQARLFIDMDGNFSDETQFATEVRGILDQLSATPLQNRVWLVFRYQSKQKPYDQYELQIDNRFEWNQDAATLAKRTGNNSVYDEMEREREQLLNQLEDERRNLEKEREQLLSQVEDERTDMQKEREQERARLEEERETLYRELERERSQLNNAA